LVQVGLQHLLEVPRHLVRTLVQQAVVAVQPTPTHLVESELAEN
jgi:hypothetical protein